MPVMVTFTLKTDPATYQALHLQLVEAAISAGLLFHSGYEVGGEVRVTDFWPSAEAFQSFIEGLMDGPAGEAMKAAGIPPPAVVKITPVLNARGR